MTGTIQSLIVELPLLNVAAGTATPGPSGTAAARFVAVDWSQFQPDPPHNRLVFQGSPSDLGREPAFDEVSACAGYIIPRSPGGPMAHYAGLWRLGSALGRVNLQDLNGNSLGE